MSDFDVKTSAGSYRVTIRERSYDRELRSGGYELVLADRFFAASLARSPIPVVYVDSDESRKNLFEVDRLLGEFSDTGLTRSGSILAVGGGVVQDLGTFAASVYMRGVRWTYVPTTLMSMADSCIGGKSSLNVSGTKNLAGNIYPPDAVVVDPGFIETLDAEAVVAGLGEAVKIAFCAGDEIFASYLRHFESRGEWEPLIDGVLRAKKWFVEIDEFDQRERRLLNFGHTFGHALEAATEFSVSHGVAIVVGMLAASALRRDLLGPEAADELLRVHCCALLRELPTLRSRLGETDLDRFRAVFLRDKKHPRDGLRVILPRAEVVGVEEVSLPRSTGTLDAVDRALMSAMEMIA